LPKSAIDSLHTLTNRLLAAAPDEFNLLLNTTRELYELLVHVTALDTDAPAHRDNNHLQTGKAIGTTWAAMCIQDLLRTKKFMDGVYHAVLYLQQAQPGKKIHVLYAGTGPFAALVLPLTARFTSDELQFTLLEVNEGSYECLQSTLAAFELQDYVNGMYCTDATAFRVPAGVHVDILLSETMQHALIKEPQVAILMNLLPQLPGDCLLIPEKIILEAVMVNDRNNTRQKLGEPVDDSDVQYKLGDIFELNREIILSSSPVADISNHNFPSITVDVPPGIIKNFRSLTIQTTIHVFQTDVLLPAQCALTLPLALEDLSSHPQTTQVQFRYVTGKNPGLQHMLIPGYQMNEMISE
jgi:predicted RNA methylase